MNNRDTEYRNCIVRAFRALENMRMQVLQELRDAEFRQLQRERARAQALYRTGTLSCKTQNDHAKYMTLLRNEQRQLTTL